MTKAEVRERVRELGMRATWSSEWQEWKVYRPGSPESRLRQADIDDY